MPVIADTLRYIPEQHWGNNNQYPTILHPRDVEQIPVSREEIAELNQLLTPKEILEGDEFDDPTIIGPPTYPNFDSLLAERERIRMLQIVPFKRDWLRSLYKGLPKEDLLQSIENTLSNEPLVLAPNHFPSFLPDDVVQRVLWIRDKNTDPAPFIAQCIVRLGIPLDEAIFYERPRKAQKPISGTVPEIRHVHVLTRAKPKK